MTEAADVRGDGRDGAELERTLSNWLIQKVPGGDPVISSLTRSESNGMSSESILFDLDLTENGERITRPCVIRLAPESSNVPVFPRYDMALQFRVISLVAERTDVPVPTPRWLETDEAALGSPFFVMDRIEGRVPPDVMPYNFGSWLMEADRADQDRLVAATVGILAEIHSLDPDHVDLAFLQLDTPGDTALRRHVAATRRYYDWATGDHPIGLLERCFDWLDRQWPPTEGPAVLNWGDARIGNVMYQGFQPVAVLDWEMAGVGPREMDLVWGVFLHRFFEDIATDAGLPGMPHFLRLDDVVAEYRRLTGYEPCDLRWFFMYSALRHGIIMSRIHIRQVKLGAAVMPDDPDDLVMHRRMLEAMLDDTYWSKL